MSDLCADDIARLTPKTRRLHVVRETRYHTLKLATTHDANGDAQCVALRGTIAKRVSCRIYARRPDLCRTFEPGSEHCQDARAERGLPL